MISSLSNSSIKQYNCVYKKWWQFCLVHKIDFFTVDIPMALTFLTLQFENGANYSTINTNRSALSLILGKRFSNDERVSRFVRGVFRMKPSFPRYLSTWDPNLVLDFVSKSYPKEGLSLDVLTKKMVALLALSTGQRVQTRSMIRLNNINLNNTNIDIVITDLIKTSAPGHQMPRMTIPYFSHREQICPAKTLRSYIEKTQVYRNLLNTENLILTTRKPIHNACASTISRWIKQVLSMSGVDTTVFSAHSTRHASTSAAGRRGVSIDIIKKAAGWSGNSLTFAKFYNRPLTTDEDVSFAEAVYNN